MEEEKTCEEVSISPVSSVARERESRQSIETYLVWKFKKAWFSYHNERRYPVHCDAKNFCQIQIFCFNTWWKLPIKAVKKLSQSKLYCCCTKGYSRATSPSSSKRH